jgi:hypothetical protein
MLSFSPSPAHSHYYSPLYSARPVYADDIIYLHPSTTSDYYSLPRTTTDPESHYRCALEEYLIAEQELFRAREEATLRARTEALRRQEEARLLQAQIIRVGKERQVRQLEQVLAQERAAALTAEAANSEVHLSLPRMVPAACSVPEKRSTPMSNVLAAQTPVLLTDGSHLLDPMAQSPANEVCRIYILSASSA